MKYDDKINDPSNEPLMISEPPAAYEKNDRIYTIEDIYALPEGVWAELIDGALFYLGAPLRIHQDIVGEMYYTVKHYIREHNGPCKVYDSPFGVFLNADDSTFVIPDLTVICDLSKLNDHGCCGAPDWIVEVLSPSTAKRDKQLKYQKYKQAGVKEYWIIDPVKRMIAVYLFNETENVRLYSFEESVPVSLFPELKIRLADSL